ncbi:Eco57I restriction-modification methylase domain-containing protein [Gemmatimonas sp.]|uniref:Eco57I restriction-modification methylase domain-containing protein n=1 Tax=Gemmatimonas sp. TaxID=1962908 RepID=UPI0035689526
MLTLRAAAQLLAQADSRLLLRPIAHAMGFTATPTTLSADGRDRLRIDALTSSADLVRGPGTLRLLCAELAPPTDLAGATDPRELTKRLAATMLQQAPARHWCLITLDARLRTLCIATVGSHSSGPRVAALRIDRTRVVDSDADTLRTLAAVPEQDALLRHARFTDILRREALSNRFYGILERAVTTLATDMTDPAASDTSPADRRELALLCTSRCLFLAFLEAKGWLDHRLDFLLHHTTAQLELGGQLHQRLLRPLFFGTLNTPRCDRAPAARRFGAVPFLNGGLFSPTPLEKRHRTLRFSDDAIAHLVGAVLDRHRFTAHEDSASWSEAAVDPEMLGRAFESLMATDERRRSGSYYTPPALVDQVVRDALFSALPDLPPDALDDTAAPLVLTPATTDALHGLRMLDPACGSGAFLVHTLERLGTVHRRTQLVAASRLAASSVADAHRIRRQLLTHCIFGVDRNPVAVWLCELRLWLSVVIECTETDITRVPPLPNLDHHIRVGDSLAGGNFRFAPPSARTLTALRERYTRATGPRKQSIALALQREERQRAMAELSTQRDALRADRAALLSTIRARDLFGQRRAPGRADHLKLDALRAQCRELSAARAKLADGGALPFRFVTYFADVAATGGFNVLIGNPPWVRPHALAPREREQLRREFRSMRAATWHAGAARAGAGVGFASQPDLSVAFIERSLELLAPGGTLALLVPAKLWRTLSGGGIRRTIAQYATVHTIRDWSDAPALFDAATYPSLLVARKHASAQTPTHSSLPTPTLAPTDIHVTVSTAHGERHFPIPTSRLSLDGDAAAPWILLPPPAHTAFERLRTAGPALGDSPLGRPLLGVKCGCNAAFLVHAQEHDDDSATVVASDNPAPGTASVPRSAIIERRLLRPALRGEGITARSPKVGAPVAGDELRILWTHGLDGLPLRTLPPATARWLAHWRPRLESRRDARPRMPWWTLFRTEAARADTPRVVWADIGKRLRTRVLDAGDPTVPLNSCYVMRTASLDDAYALDALLNSTIAAAWLDVLAEPARGGFRRFLGWTVAALPVPHDWLRARTLLAPIGQRLAKHEHVPIDEHDLAVADAYDVPLRQLTPLLDWYTP